MATTLMKIASVLESGRGDPSSRNLIEGPAEQSHIGDLAAFLGEHQQLFAILDTAKERSLLETLRTSGEEHRSLYENLGGVDLQLFAPYLVPLKPASPVIHVFAEEGWGQNWGTLLSASTDVDELWAHFQQWILVTLPTERKAFFRFYDPRVLRVFLPTCNAEELHLFFGPVKSYFVESENADELIQFTIEAGQLCEIRFPRTPVI